MDSPSTTANLTGVKTAAHELGDKNWCDGNTFTLADIALGCALGFPILRFEEIKWRVTYPILASLTERLEQRTSFIDTAPPVTQS
tara:strand:+ start:197 stop:451 length:255 start_codon:yes stop_codon:yes gene_type:complete